MGSAFSCLPRYGWCVPKHHHDIGDKSQAPRKLKGHRRNISAAFNMADLDTEYSVEKVNINTASEEELMTLPGISRHIAHSVIEYRHQIGGFKRVEDLALVTGVGATKLAALRLEICVHNKKTSLNASLCSSQQDISFGDDTSRTSSKSLSSASKSSLINVNTSNVFQLMKIRGLSQQLAENIVIHRDKKGPFKTLDDLVKVKGIKPGVLSAIRPQLTLQHVMPSCSSSSHLKPVAPRKSSSARNSLHSANHAAASLSAAETGSVIRKLDSQEDLCSLYGPLGRRSVRVLNRSLSLHSAVTAPTADVIRLASWNLQQCCSDKTSNPGVKEVFAMTLLENQ